MSGVVNNMPLAGFWMWGEKPRDYYQKYFPIKDYIQWLTYGKDDNFKKRDFTFIDGAERWKRFVYFQTGQQLLEYLEDKFPYRIDLGAIYEEKIKVENSEKQRIPVQRELVFDIDANDYDEVRTCCSDANICEKCWKYIAMACQILHSTLEQDFNFKNIFWTFSGRRGIHAWVCDERIRNASEYVRSHILKYIKLIDCRPGITKRVNLPKGQLTAQMQRALDIIKPKFVQVCIEEQQLLNHPDNISKFLNMTPSGYVRTTLERLFENCNSGIERWNTFVDFVEKDDQQRLNGTHLVDEIMLQFCYPRLDTPVTTQKNHLLKSPFSMHPKTSKISIPFNPKDIYEFNIENVPTVPGLVDEFQSEKKEKMIKLFEQSLKDFGEFLVGCDDKRCKEREDKLQKIDAGKSLQNGSIVKFFAGLTGKKDKFLKSNKEREFKAKSTCDNSRISSEISTNEKRTIDVRCKSKEEEKKTKVEKMLKPIERMEDVDLEAPSAHDKLERTIVFTEEASSEAASNYFASFKTDGVKNSSDISYESAIVTSTSGYSSQDSTLSNASNGLDSGQLPTGRLAIDQLQKIQETARAINIDCSLPPCTETEMEYYRMVSRMIKCMKTTRRDEETIWLKHERTSKENSEKQGDVKDSSSALSFKYFPNSGITHCHESIPKKQPDDVITIKEEKLSAEAESDDDCVILDSVSSKVNNQSKLIAQKSSLLSSEDSKKTKQFPKTASEKTNDARSFKDETSGGTKLRNPYAKKRKRDTNDNSGNINKRK